MILECFFSHGVSSICKSFTQRVEDLDFAVAGEVSFLLCENPRHFGLVRLRMLVLDRFILGTVISHAGPPISGVLLASLTFEVTGE